MWNMRCLCTTGCKIYFSINFKATDHQLSKRLYITHKEQVLLNKLRTEVMFSYLTENSGLDKK